MAKLGVERFFAVITLFVLLVAQLTVCYTTLLVFELLDSINLWYFSKPVYAIIVGISVFYMIESVRFGYNNGYKHILHADIMDAKVQLENLTKKEKKENDALYNNRLKDLRAIDEINQRTKNKLDRQELNMQGLLERNVADKRKELNELIEKAKSSKEKTESEFNILKDQLKNEMESKKKSLEVKEADLQERIASWDKLEHAMSKRKDLDEVVLNIGGKEFRTYTDTLRCPKSSFFSGLMSEQFNQQPSANGMYFIDRDPRYFEIILNWMRGYNIYNDVKALEVNERENLLKDVDFYCLPKLAESIKKKFNKE